MLSVARKYIALVTAEYMLSKALGVSEMAQSARIEVRLRQFLTVSWDKLSEQASKKAASMARQRKSAKSITAAVAKIMDNWSGDITPIFEAEFENIYRLGREVGHKKATGQIKGELRYTTPIEISKAKLPSVQSAFGLVDQAAVKALKKHQLFWIGDHYDKTVSSAIAETTRATIAEAGRSSTLAGELMGQRVAGDLKYVHTPEMIIGSQKQYFENVTASAMTTARVHGKMRSFAEVGVSKYRISNPSDHRTCERCGHMEGKEFTTQQGINQMQSELSAENPDQVKAAHPWPTEKELKATSSTPGYVGGAAGKADSEALSKSGLALPSYHGKCRCTVDVTAESMRYENLMPIPQSVAPSSIPRAKSVPAWRGGLSSKEKSAFKNWNGDGYHDIRRLDAGDFTTSWLATSAGQRAQKSLRSMRDALARSPIYSGEAHRALGKLSPEQAKKIAKVGNIIQQDAISNWSKSGNVAQEAILGTNSELEQYVTMEISTSKKSFDVMTLGVRPKEKALLLEKGKRMLIKKVRKMSWTRNDRKYKGYHLHLEEID